jgi:hypothetical protein
VKKTENAAEEPEARADLRQEVKAEVLQDLKSDVLLGRGPVETGLVDRVEEGRSPYP